MTDKFICEQKIVYSLLFSEFSQNPLRKKNTNVVFLKEGNNKILFCGLEETLVQGLGDGSERRETEMCLETITEVQKKLRSRCKTKGMEGEGEWWILENWAHRTCQSNKYRKI